MKTQLLEDIGQSAEVSLTPSRPAVNPTAGKGAQDLAPARKAQPARPRSATGVWRQKPAGEPQAPAPQPVDEPPRKLDTVFDEIAALEAQFLRPGQQPAPAIAPIGPPQALPASPAESLHQPAIPQAEATLAPDPARRAAAPQDPLFDFTPPSPAAQVADPFTPAAGGFTQSRKRHLVWAACALSGALLIWGGRWASQERNDAGSLALIATEAKGALRVDSALTERAIAATASTPPAMPASSPMPDVPPLVMLEPDPPAAVKREQPAPLAAAGGERPTAPKTGHAAQQRPAAPSPKPSSRKARERSGAAATPAKERRQREPARPLARAAAIRPERPAGQDTSMAALLKACREHGYHATQCIKRQCSVGKYGFACRGR